MNFSSFPASTTSNGDISPAVCSSSLTWLGAGSPPTFGSVNLGALRGRVMKALLPVRAHPFFFSLKYVSLGNAAAAHHNNGASLIGTKIVVVGARRTGFCADFRNGFAMFGFSLFKRFKRLFQFGCCDLFHGLSVSRSGFDVTRQSEVCFRG